MSPRIILFSADNQRVHHRLLTMQSTKVRSLQVGSVCCTDHLCDFGSHRFSCGIFSSTVKIQAMECSIVVGCYESPVGLRQRTLKRFRKQLNGKTSITNDHVTGKRILHILQCTVGHVFRPLIKQCEAQLSE